MPATHLPACDAAKLRARVVARCQNAWREVTRDNLPRRIFKCVLATTLTVIVILIPNIKDVYGKAGYLACMTTVFVFAIAFFIFGHPGRRLGAMVEALVLATAGASIGVAWSSLGTYLSSLAYPHNPHGAMAIRAVFIMIAAFVHSYVRITTPRLYILVLLMIIPTLIGLTSPTIYLTKMYPIQFFYPILTAVAILFLVSVLIFPEFGSMYLGHTTIETLQKIQDAQKRAHDLFLSYSGYTKAEDQLKRLKELSATKAALRSKVAQCKATLTECSFELAFSFLAPAELKPIAGKGVNALVGKTVSLIGACESKYALLGFEEPPPQNSSVRNSLELSALQNRKDFGYGDEDLLRYLLRRVEGPLQKLQITLDRAMDIITTAVAYTYDVPRMPSLKQGTGHPRRPQGILLQEMDVHIDTLTEAINEFNLTSIDALESAAILTEMNQSAEDEDDVDVLPRDEVFLVSSFLLHMRKGAEETLKILRHARTLVEHREQRGNFRTVYLPRISSKWLFSGSDELSDLPDQQRQAAQREGRRRELQDDDYASMSDGESVYSQWRRDQSRKRDRRVRRRRANKKPLFLRIREGLGDTVDRIHKSDNLLYAFKFTCGVMLVTWPSFVAQWTTWFSLYRGVWAALIFVLVFESAVGATIWIYILRTVGTLIGSLWGYAAYSARGGNEFVIAVMIMLGTIPSFYVQLGTKYNKAGMVCTISMCVVALSTHLVTVPGTAQENFIKRFTTMLIGGAVATVVQLSFFPAKARDRLKDSLATAITQINKMETCIALGVDETRNITTSPQLSKRFNRAAKKASAALAAADAFLGFTAQEPRLKGSFADQAPVYKEIIFVLRQIVERMDNMLALRMSYGSAVLEQYNSRVYDYRRNVAASVTITLFAVHEALTTKLPLPQFLPSTRIAHTRMVVRVRQILTEERENAQAEERIGLQNLAARRALRLKLLSWNASSAALEEMVEYLEELVDLTKMLVGANEFRSGILDRPKYAEYVQRVKQMRMGGADSGDDEGDGHEKSEDGDNGTAVGTIATATGTATGTAAEKRSLGRGSRKDNRTIEEDDEMPGSLVRIQSRVLERKRTELSIRK